MPTSPNIGPFCMPTGSTCCGDTFCVAGQSCCGEFCCAAVSPLQHFRPRSPLACRPVFPSKRARPVFLTLKTEICLQRQDHRLRLLPLWRHLPGICTPYLLRSRLVKLLEQSLPAAPMLSLHRTLLSRLQTIRSGLLCQLHDRVFRFLCTGHDRGWHFRYLCTFCGRVYDQGCYAYGDYFCGVEWARGCFP